MADKWQVAEGTGWIQIPGFGRINPRRDNVDGGRQYFDALLDNDEYATATGSGISGGPQTWQFEFDEAFLLADHRGGRCQEVSVSLLVGGRFAVKHRPGLWPERGSGGW